MRTAAVLVGVPLLACVVLAVAFMLLPGCGVRFGPLGDLDLCAPASPGLSAAMVREEGRRATLEGRMRGLEFRLASLPACPAPEPPPESPEIPEPPPPPPPDPDRLDPEMWAARDISLLEGCWNLVTDMDVIALATREIRPVESLVWCFDDVGFGHERREILGGEVCTGGIRASFNQAGNLDVWNPANLSCTGLWTSGASAWQYECRLLTGGDADCSYRSAIDGRMREVRLTTRASP